MLQSRPLKTHNVLIVSCRPADLRVYLTCDPIQNLCAIIRLLPKGLLSTGVFHGGGSGLIPCFTPRLWTFIRTNNFNNRQLIPQITTSLSDTLYPYSHADWPHNSIGHLQTFKGHQLAHDHRPPYLQRESHSNQIPHQLGRNSPL